jgi:hypothetical protein
MWKEHNYVIYEIYFHIYLSHVLEVNTLLYKVDQS